MIETGEISRYIHKHTFNHGKKLYVEEARIGLGYIGVMLEGGRLGLSALPRNELSPGCAQLKRAGSLAGSAASELLDFIVGARTPLERALGLATANAVNCTHITEEPEKDSISLMNLSTSDEVAMVGYFGPLVKRIRKTGANLHIIERDPDRMEVIDRKDRNNILEKCSVAIITATSILNNTIEEILNELGNPRHVSIMGPSTPMIEDVFADTPATHLSGAVVINPSKIMQVISEGGGTPNMRPFLRFIDKKIEHAKDTEEI